MSKRRTIICIEDDADTRDLLVEELEDAGFEVLAFDQGASGLAAIAAHRPDLILCDIDLPGLSGLDVLRSVPDLGRGVRSIPFIFLTAYGQRENQILARQLGCDDYIVKPIDFELLVGIIGNRIARSAERPSPPTDIHLTNRERQALTWSARGKSSADIAVLIGVAERTVNFHIDNAVRKLGVATRIQAAVKAALLNLIDVLDESGR